jgi:multidrug efflux pump
MPNSFLPNEDQGYIIANIQLPPGATAERTNAVLKAAEDYVLKQPEVADMVAVTGFSFSGQGQNMGLAFIPLKALGRAQGQGFGRTEPGRPHHDAPGRAARLLHLRGEPAADPGTGPRRRLLFRLQDRGGNGHAALLQARNQMLGMACRARS